ncbi:RING finger protein 37-like [Saccostrea echinata]|uniref:RING finger protein 37-like n=1 Tax=Saccostrea echinata TaxID=191078 RepID=UPI002A830F62|nr:RING finger protein 37-like [Saccostrea echinata]
MLLNFCDSRLYPKISCDKVSVDGYDVKNLISGDLSNRQKGFLGEYFIKPPVTITLSFPCNIEIKNIIINPCVSAQKSSGLEIQCYLGTTVYSKSNQVKTGPLWEHVSEVSPKDKNAYEYIFSAVFSPIGKVQLTDPDTVCFENRLFQPLSADQVGSFPKSPYKHHVELRGRNSRALSFVSDLNIRVTRTAAGRSVAIKSIEVWGQPSRSVPRSVREKLNHLFCTSTLSNLVPPFKERNILNQNSCEQVLRDEDQKDRCYTEQTSVQLPRSSSHLEGGVEIPEDFTDAISCEIMSVPILLPCEKNIDQSTLEKHNSAEASWGRLPSDPFTGVPYDNKNKPLPNVHLKLRIDKFMLENSDKLQHVPRTLGRNTDNSLVYAKNGPETSRLVENSGKRADSTYFEQNESERNNLKKEESRKRKNPDLCSDIKGKRLRETGNETSTTASLVNNTANCVIDLTKDEKISITGKELTKIKFHDEELKESINSAFSDILSQLPSFTKTVNMSQEKAGPSNVADHSQKLIENNCSSCNEQCDSMYKAPCGHLFCRKCLLKQRNYCSGIFDKTCQKSWKSNEISKVH